MHSETAHLPLRSGQATKHTVFFSGYQDWSIVVILNTTRGTWHWKAHYMRKTRDSCVFHCECLSLATSSLPMNLKWGTGRRSGYSIMPENEVGPNIALHASPTSRNSTVLILTVPIHSTLFLPMAMLFKCEVFCVRTGRWRIGLLGLCRVYELDLYWCITS